MGSASSGKDDVLQTFDGRPGRLRLRGVPFYELDAPIEQRHNPRPVTGEHTNWLALSLEEPCDQEPGAASATDHEEMCMGFHGHALAFSNGRDICQMRSR